MSSSPLILSSALSWAVNPIPRCLHFKWFLSSLSFIYLKYIFLFSLQQVLFFFFYLFEYAERIYKTSFSVLCESHHLFCCVCVDSFFSWYWFMNSCSFVSLLWMEVNFVHFTLLGAEFCWIPLYSVGLCFGNPLCYMGVVLSLCNYFSAFLGCVNSKLSSRPNLVPLLNWCPS